MAFMRAALCTAHGMSARAREGEVLHRPEKLDPESLPLISLSIRRYPDKQSKVIRTSKSRFVMSSQVGRLWLAIRTSYIPWKGFAKTTGCSLCG